MTEFKPTTVEDLMALVDLCVTFAEKHDFEFDDFGNIDGQELFESVGEDGIVEFFNKMYKLLYEGL